MKRTTVRQWEPSWRPMHEVLPFGWPQRFSCNASYFHSAQPHFLPPQKREACFRRREGGREKRELYQTLILNGRLLLSLIYVLCATVISPAGRRQWVNKINDLILQCDLLIRTHRAMRPFCRPRFSLDLRFIRINQDLYSRRNPFREPHRAFPWYIPFTKNAYAVKS